MRLKLALPFLLSALCLILPASSWAGSFDIDYCSAGFNTGAWASSITNNPLPGGWTPYINHNEPGSSGLASSHTNNSNLKGFDAVSGHNSVDYDGDGRPDYDTYSVVNSEVLTFKSCPGSGYYPLRDGVGARNPIKGGEVGTGQWGTIEAHGVGNGSKAATTLYGPPNGTITGLGGRIYTLSAKYLCNTYGCSSSGDLRRRARNPMSDNNSNTPGGNESDKFWEASYWRDWGAVYNETCQGGCNPELGWGVSWVINHIECKASGGCLTSTTGDASWEYERAVAKIAGGSTATLYEAVLPSASTSGNMFGSWVRGTRTATVNSTDTSSGVRYTNVSFNSGALPGGNEEGCSFTKNRPCPENANRSYTVDTTRLSDGRNTFNYSVTDAAQNNTSGTTDAYVDNQLPNNGGSCSHSLSIPDGNIASDGRRWLRSTITVATGGCDAVSGLYQYRVQYQSLSPSQYTPGQSLNWGGASWQDAPGSSCVNASQGAAGQVWSLNCSFNTASFPDGTAVRFRSTWIDLAGNLYESSPSDVRYLDNTAPVLENMKWQAFKTADSSWVNVDNGWTNAKKTRLTWNPISAGNGSPINKYFYTYESDLEQSGTGACATQQPDGWLSAVGVTSTPALEEERSEECRQGKHQVWVWVQDIAGNGAVSSPPSSYKNAVAGTSQISYDSVPTAETRDLTWAKADSLMPKDLVTDPLDWSLNNSFTLKWTNPSITNTVTQSPIDIIYYQVGGGTTINGSSVDDVQSYSSCIGSGAQCTLPGVKAPSEGSHPVRVWVKDAAGNSSLEQSAASQINWRKNRCVTPQ